MRILIVLAGLIGGLAPELTAQIPWSYQQTSDRHIVYFEQGSVMIGGVPIDSGDVIGVFYNSNGDLKCAGYKEWLDTPSPRRLVAYGRDDSNPGFKPGDTMHFRIWDRANNCIVQSFNVQYSPDSQYPNTRLFVDSGFSRVQSMKGKKGLVSYDRYGYCKDAKDPLPELKNINSSITFNSPNNLVINENTGKINVSASIPGIYGVTYETDVCLRRNQDTFHIKSVPNVDLGPDRTMCSGDTITLKLGSDPNQLKWSVSSSSAPNEHKLEIPIFKGGEYWLKAWSSDGCVVTDSITITELKKPEIDLPDSVSGCEPVKLEVKADRNTQVQWSNGDSDKGTKVNESGYYWVEKENAAGCIKRDSVYVTVSPSMDLHNMEASIKPTDCGKNGEISLKASQVQGGIPPYKFHLVPYAHGRSMEKSEPVFQNLNAGTYRLDVEDSMGCKASLPQSLTVKRRDCKKPVISLDGDGRGDEYYIPYKGQAKIYDRQGRLKKKMQIPNDWDGTDQNGQKVPMGTYLIVCNGKKEILITVIR